MRHHHVEHQPCANDACTHGHGGRRVKVARYSIDGEACLLQMHAIHLPDTRERVGAMQQSLQPILRAKRRPLARVAATLNEMPSKSGRSEGEGTRRLFGPR